MGRPEKTAARRTVYLAAKRVFDFSVAAFALVVLSPVLAGIAIAISLSGKGGPFFLQERTGLGGRSFTMIKFRTMQVDNDAAIHRAYVTGLIEGTAVPRESLNGEHVYLLNDPRVTRLGRWLRAFSLDELPNLVNVLRGDMSLVGPRPPIPYEVELYDERARGRLAAKPGMTGLAQIRGRGSLTFEQIIEFDLDYVRRRSLWLDLSIVLRTIPAVLTRRGV